MLSNIRPVASGRFADIKHDPSGQRLATPSSDGGVYFWATTPEASGADPTALQPVGVIKGHEGPVWAVAFAPSEYESICATGGADRKVIIWSEVAPNDWKIVFWDDSTNKAGITSLAFCAIHPSQGVSLAVASLDGSVTIYSLTNEGWVSKSFLAHVGGVRSLGWSTSPVGADSRAPDQQQHCCRLLATGGTDCRVCVWHWEATSQAWLPKARFSVKRPIVHLQWQPANESARDLIAVLTVDGTVSLWEQEHDRWEKLAEFPRLAPGALKLSWSLDGMLLSIPIDSPIHVRIIRENAERQWELHNMD